MRYVCSAAVLAVSLLSSSVMFAQGVGLSITNYKFVRQSPVTLTMWNVTYSATVVNTGAALGSVQAQVTSLNPATVRTLSGQDILNFGAVSANGQATSTNTITLLVNRAASPPFDFSMLQWSFTTTAAAPIANAGPNQTVPFNSTVTLDGSGSTNPSGGALTYSWVFTARPPGSVAILIGSQQVHPSFFVDAPGNYTIQLTVSNGTGSSSGSVTVSTLNSAPVANAGADQTVTVGSTVTLNGSGSTDVDGDALTYSWTLTGKPLGSNATLSGATTSSPSFLADLFGIYTAQLIVNDGHGNNSPAAIVTITTQNTTPVAKPGANQSVNVGSLVQLNGSGSTDVDGDSLTYQWSFNAFPSGSAAPTTLSSATAVNPTFTADLPGTYIVQLIVTDNHGNVSPAATVTITTNQVLAPTANAGPNQSLPWGTSVQLSGSGTDPQGLTLTYHWSLTNKPANSNATLTATIANPAFVADVPGQYIAQLIVSNGFMNSAPAVVTINSTNTPPDAKAGADQNVITGATVTLDGSGSSDPDHNTISYAWSFLTRPGTSATPLFGANTAHPSFVADVSGTYVVQLIVSDPFVPSSPATVTITAAAAPTITLTPNPLNLATNAPGTLTVSLSAPAGNGGQLVNLTSGNPGVATVPASVTVPQGNTGANVTVTPTGVGSATITAFGAPLVPGTATVNVATPVISLSVDSSSLAITHTMNGTITLSAPAPTGGISVSLGSLPAGIVGTPPSVFIAAGSTTGTFSITGSNLGSTVITASSPGYTSGTASVTVGTQGQISIPSGLSVGPNQSVPFAVGLTNGAPAGGVTVTLSSGDNTKVTVNPTSVFIAQGATAPSTQPQVTGVNFGSATITASASGFVSGNQTVQVSGSLSFSPQTAFISTNATQNLTLNLLPAGSSAPAGGLTINLSSSNTSAATVPATVLMPANASSVSIPVTAGAAAGSATIHASDLPILADTTASVSAVSFGTLNLPSTLTVQVGQSATLNVSLPNAAPTGGVTVTLNSTDSTKASVPASVFIAAGATTPATQPQVTGNAVGSATINASAAGYASASTTVTVAPGSPASVTATAGTPQNAPVNTAFATALQATVKDSGGNNVGANVVVTFTVNSASNIASATFPGGATQVNANTTVGGIATAPALTANGILGSYTVTAVVSGATSASYALTNIVGNATSVVATSGTPQSAQIGNAFANSLAATVKDSGGNPVGANVSVVFTVVSVNGAGAAFAGNPTVTVNTNANGVATAPALTANNTTGSYTVTASVNGAGSAATFSLTNTAGNPATVTATSGTPQTVQINNPFAPLVATVKDASSNPVSGATVTFTVTPVGQASGSFPGSQPSATATTNANGVATAPAFTANATAGSYTVTASVGAASSATYSLTNSVGSAASVTATSGTGQSAQISTAFASPLVATVKDSGGNPVSGVVVTFTAGTVGATGTFAGNPTATATTNASGVATAPAFTANTIAGSYTVVATASGAGSAPFALTNTTGNAASITATGGTPQSAQVSTAFASPLVATVKDSGGNPVSGVTVTFTATVGGATGTFAGNSTATATTGANGVATSPAFTANATAGAYSVTASVSGATSATFSLTNTAGAASSITATGGTPQTVPISTSFAPLVATVKDSGGNGVSGVTVTFTANPIGGATGAFAGNATATATSNASGVATAPTFTANTIAGSYTVTASIAGGATATFPLTNSAGNPASITATSGTPQTVQINTAFAALVATVKDGSNNVVSGATVTFTVTAAGNGASGSFPGSQPSATATTNANGVATAPAFTANAQAGSYTVTAAVSGASSATYSLTNSAGTAASITATSGTPQSAQISTAFAAPMVATAKDSGGNPVSGVAITFAAGTVGASGAFAGNPTATATTDASGVATAPAFAANTITGSYTVTASASGANSANFSLTNTPGTAASIAATSGTPQTVQISAAFASLVATVKDGNGNLVGSGVPVTFTVTAAGNGASGSFPGSQPTATVNTSASGVATAPTFTANTIAGSYTVTASIAGGATATYSLTNTAGTAASVTATSGTPQTVAINTALASLVATVKDSGGNPVNNATVTFTVNGTTAKATFAGNATTATATSNASGVATAPTLTANGTTGSYTITASVSGATTSATFSITNGAGAPATITANSGTGQSATINTAFASPLVVTVKDSVGNLVSGAVVTFTGPASGASIVTTTATTNSVGVASAPVTANATASATAYTVTASITGATSATFSLTNNVGPAAAVTASAGTPQSTAINTAFATQLQVTVKDAGGNPVGSGVSVTLQSVNTQGQPGAIFTGGSTVVVLSTNFLGVVNAPTLTANGTPGSFTVTASIAGGASTTFSLTNLSGTPATVVATSGTPQTVPVNTAFAALAATVKDASGNPVGAGFTVTFTAPASGPSGTFSTGATATATTNASGVATAPAFTANATPGSFTVTASVTGATSASFSLTNGAGTPASVTATGGTPQSAGINSAFAALLATVKDSNGIGVGGVTVTFTINPAGGPGAGFSANAQSATATTNASGVATAPTLTANGQLGSFTVTASITGGFTATYSLTNIVGAAASVTATGGTPQSVQINVAFASLVATVKDSGGNAVAGSTVTFTVASGTGGSSAGFSGGGTATATTNASGVATAPTLTANGFAGTFTVTALVSGASSATYSLTNTVGPPATITANSGTGQSAPVSTVFTNPLVVTVKDSGGNLVSGAVVTFTGPTTGASIVTTTATTNSLGVASAPVTANGVSSTTAYTVTASITGATSATFSLTNLVGGAASVTATAGTPQSASIGTAFATQLQASVKDSGGNLVGSGVSVTWTITPSGTTSATFAGGSTVSITNTAGGVATAPIITANSFTGSFTVTASIAGGASATFSLTNNPGPAAGIAATAGTPQSAPINTAFATALQATVKDSSGNPVIAGTAVTFAITPGGTGASGAFTGSATVNTNASGVAIAPTLTVNAITGTFTVTASITGGASATFSLTVIPGPAASIAATGGTPQINLINTAFSPLQATVKDSGSNLVGANVTVTFTVTAVGGAGATFAGSATTATANTNASGVATAPTLTANSVAGSYTVTASITGATSATFSLTNSTTSVPASISANAGTPQSAIVGTPFGTQMQVKVIDSSSHPLPNITVVFTAPTSGQSGTFPGAVRTANVTTDANGLATAPVFTANGLVGTYTVVANVGTLTANFSLTNLSTASQISITNATIGFNLKTLITITLPAPANNSDPACGNGSGCQDVILTSSDMTKAAFYGRDTNPSSPTWNTLTFLRSISVGVVAGQTAASVYVEGLASSGAVIISATSGSQIGSGTITLAPAGFILSSPSSGQSFTTNPTSQTTLAVSSARLDSAGNVVELQNVADGQSINVNVASAFTSVGDVDISPLTFTGGTGSLTTTFTGAAPGSTTVTAIPPAGFATPNGGNVLAVTVNPSGLVANNYTIGNNLETQAVANFAGGAQPGLVITVASNSSNVLLSTTAGGPGSNSIQLTMCQFCGGAQTTPNFYIQAFASSGTATYTVSAPGFGSSTGTVTFAPSGILISGRFGPGNPLPTTTVSPAETITVSTVFLDSTGHSQLSQLVAGGPAGTNAVTVNVFSSNPSVGTISGSPITIGAGTASASATFAPTSAGSTTLTTDVPAGFTALSPASSVAVTVTQPGIVLQADPLTVGVSLETTNTVFLFPATNADRTVTVTTSDSNLRLSATGTDIGLSSIQLTVPAGSTSASFYLQAQAAAVSGTSATYTLSAPGYSTHNASLTYMKSGIVIATANGIGGLQGQDAVSLSGNASGVQYTVYMAQLNASNKYSQVQTLSPGSQPVSVTLTSSSTSIGTIVSPVTINPGSVGATSTFTPHATGITLVSLATPAGFTPSNNDTALFVQVGN